MRGVGVLGVALGRQCCESARHKRWHPPVAQRINYCFYLYKRQHPRYSCVSVCLASEQHQHGLMCCWMEGSNPVLQCNNQSKTRKDAA